MSNSSKALILWKPKYLFFPPVQEPPPPSRVFRHVDLIMENEEERPFFGPVLLHSSHNPHHESIFPDLFVNDTFLRYVLYPPRSLPPFIDVSPPFTELFTHPSNTLTHSQDESITDSEERGGSVTILESIDEDPLPPPSSSSKKKPAKITLKRKSPDEDDFFSTPDHQDQSADQDLPSDSHRSKTDEEASIEQWRVGRRPGFQGSFIAPRKTPKEEEEKDSRKRTFGQSILSSAEKVLKKPFRMPTKIPPKTANLVEEIHPFDIPNDTARSFFSPSSHSSTHSSPLNPVTPKSSSDITSISDLKSTPQSISNSKLDPFFPEFPFHNVQPSSTPTRSAKRPITSSPFKTPLRKERSTAPSPSSKSHNTRIVNYPKSSALASGPTFLPPIEGQNFSKSQSQSQVNSLQNEVLMLKKAIKYTTESDDERLNELIILWRGAGRDIVEKLFAIVPKPNLENNNSNGYNITDQSTPSYWNSTHGNDNGNDNNDGTDLTEEQVAFLKNAERNQDGEPIDDEGNLLIPNHDERDMKMFWDSLSGGDGDGNVGGHRDRRSGTSWSNQAPHNSYQRNGEKYGQNIHTSSPTNPKPDPTVWDFAALMRMFNVDPSLLGWNADEEDWIDVDVN
ncbi:uncharacterized protein IL334_006027 [Kwoniella shivajii]|uniref:Swi5-dependent recombination DNA repair protein 1 n=1 Tax=Kwoniella shivajii TaxID=564305 RepID=A0ABZ1D6B9_9TREE|nr:hypothetical protein IL334_006027 [Kwoniella shivajii]